MNTKTSGGKRSATSSAPRKNPTALPEGNSRKTAAPRTSAIKESETPAISTRIGHSLTLFLMVLIIAGLGFLIVLFFRPGRVQVWQSVEGSSPVIERLEPEEPAVSVREEELPEEESSEKTENEEDRQSSQMREMKVYFVKVNTEGQISLKSTVRNIDFSSSPLTKSISSLIRGPGSDEINKGSLTLIPDGTRLLSARVENGTAYLNFNEAFRFNPLGREGYLAQLKQVIYTTTEFSNIKSVQILIEGVVRDYLGGEGFYIGAPLNRESFQNNP